MKRRQALQVTTFPFMAVLLCAMGSLILLLLVIDRRAKIVARARALATLEQSEREDAAELARQAKERDDELERRRRDLRAALERDLADVDGLLRAKEERAAQAAAEAAEQRRRSQELADQIEKTRRAIAEHERTIQARRTQAKTQDQLSARLQAEVARLSAELEKLEATLADLKLVRRRQENVFSLVPYQGRHGDNRRPIYVECTRSQIVLHPGNQALATSDATPNTVRQAVDRQLADSGQRNYILILIRPSGIDSYHLLRSAIKGLDVDFGYELIEDNWVVDFGADSTTQWTHEGQQPPARPGSGNSNTGIDSSGAGTGLAIPSRSGSGGSGMDIGSNTGSGGSGTGPGSGTGAHGTGIGLGGNGSTGNGIGPTGNGVGGGTAIGSSGNSIGGSGNNIGSAATGLGGSGSATGSNGNSLGGSGNTTGSNGNGIGGSGNTTGSNGNGIGGSGTTTGSNGKGIGGYGTATGSNGNGLGGSGNSIGSNGNGIGRSSPSIGSNGNGIGGSSPSIGSTGNGIGGSGTTNVSNGKGVGGSTTTIGPAANGGSGTASTPNGIGGSRLVIGASPMPNNNGSQNGPGSSSTGSTGMSSQPSGTATTMNQPNGGPATGLGTPGGHAGVHSQDALPRPSRSAAAATARPEEGDLDIDLPRRQRLSTDSPAGDGSEGGDGMPAYGAGSRSSPPRSEPVPFTRTRDWTITIECQADAVLLSTGQKLPIASWPSGPRRDHPLRLAVEELIRRRQSAGVSARPQIRFRVHADGLRSYYQAFPALEPLQLLMKRENVIEDEEP